MRIQKEFHGELFVDCRHLHDIFNQDPGHVFPSPAQPPPAAAPVEVDGERMPKSMRMYPKW
jgi:hypothetical protein